MSNIDRANNVLSDVLPYNTPRKDVGGIKPTLKFGLTQVYLSVLNRDTFERERQNLLDQLEMEKSEILQGKLIDQYIDSGTLGRIIPRICQGPILGLVMRIQDAMEIAKNRHLEPLEKISLLLGRRVGEKTPLAPNDDRRMRENDLKDYFLVSENLAYKDGQPHIRMLLDEARLPLEGFLNLMVFLFERSLHANDNLIFYESETGSIRRGQVLIYGIQHPLYPNDKRPRNVHEQREELDYCRRYEAVIHELSEDFLKKQGIIVASDFSRSEILRMFRNLNLRPQSLPDDSFVIQVEAEDGKLSDDPWTRILRHIQRPEDDKLN